LPPEAELTTYGARTALNAALVLGARIGGKVAAFVVVVAMWNHLGAGRYGEFSTLVTMSALAGVIADLGLTTLYTREAARDPSRLRDRLGAVLSVKIPLSVLGFIVLAVALALSGRGLLAELGPALALMVAASYATLLRATFYAQARLGYEAWAIAVETVTLLVLVLLGVLRSAGVSWFIWCYTASYSLSAIYATAVLLARGASPRWHAQRGLIRGLLIAGLPFALTGIVTTLYFRIDVVLLVWYGVGYTMVGWYTAAYKYLEALLFVPTTLASILFPVFAALNEASRERVIAAYRNSYRALAILGMPLTVGGTLVAARLIDLTRGFPQSAAALRVLCLAIVLLFVNNALIVALTAIGRQWDFAAITVVSLAFNVACNALLIPGLLPIPGVRGYIGAAWATVLTEMVLFACAWWRLRLHLHALDWLNQAGRPILAAAVMGVAVWPVRDRALWVSLPVGVVVYGAALLISGGLGDSELALLRASYLRLRGAAA
jgi:O-antigen/teichoic acid export membrane protein